MFLKLDELSSQNYTTLANSVSFKQMLIDSNKTGNFLKTKEIYYYNIIEYPEDTSLNISIIGGMYALGIAHLTLKMIKGL